MRFFILSSMRFLPLSRGVGPAPGFVSFVGERWGLRGAWDGRVLREDSMEEGERCDNVTWYG